MNNIKNLLPFIDMLFILILFLIVIISHSNLNPGKIRFLLENFYFFKSKSMVLVGKEEKHETKPMVQEIYPTKEEIQKSTDFIIKILTKDNNNLKIAKQERYKDISVNLQKLSLKDIKKVCKEIKIYQKKYNISDIYITGNFYIKRNSNITDISKLATQSLKKFRKYCRLKTGNIFLKVKLKFE